MNGFRPDRRPQQLAQMMAMQERNRSIGAPAGQRDMAMRQMPGMGYGQSTPNAAPGVPPQTMNFNGPPTTPQPGMMQPMPPQMPQGMPQGMPPQGMPQMPPQMPQGMPQGMPQMSPQMLQRMQGMAPQVGGPMMRPRMPSPAGMTTPQGGTYRGDFENG
jgi:hypothetical protein